MIHTYALCIHSLFSFFTSMRAAPFAVSRCLVSILYSASCIPSTGTVIEQHNVMLYAPTPFLQLCLYLGNAGPCEDDFLRLITNFIVVDSSSSSQVTFTSSRGKILQGLGSTCFEILGSLPRYPAIPVLACRCTTDNFTSFKVGI